MSILSTFYIMFAANTDQVEKGTKKAEQSTKDLEGSLSRTDAAARAAGEHITETFAEVGAAILAAFSAERLFEFIKGTAELNEQLGVTAERLGIDIGDLDAWGQATERAGGTVAGFTQTLDFLNRGIADIATKGTSRLKPFFDELKIRVTDAPHHVRPLLDILGDLADRMQHLGAQQRAGIAEKLGIDEGTVLLLAQGRRGVADLVEEQRKLGVANEKDAIAAHAFNDAIENLQQRFRHIATTLGTELLPMVSGFLDRVGRLVDYLASHKQLIVDFFAGTGAVIGTLFLPQIIKAAVASAIFIGEWLLIPVAILAAGAAIALVTDDLHAFLVGNKSVIGELTKSWPWVGDAVRSAVTAAGGAWHWFVDLLVNSFSLVRAVLYGVVEAWLQIGQGIFSVVKGFGAFAAGLLHVFPFWEKVFGAIGKGLAWVVGLLEKGVALWARFGAGAVAALPKAFGKWAHDIDAVTGRTAAPPGSPPTLPGASRGLAHALDAARAAIHTADVSPFASAPGAAFNQSSTTREIHVTTGPITVAVPNGDPATITKGLTDHLQDMMRQTLAHFDDGVKA